MAVAFQDVQFNASSFLCQTSTTYLVLPILYSATFIIGLSGNVLSLWVFMVKISTKTPTHIYLINLGISNLILCLTMPFNAVYYAFSTSWPASSLKCQLAINFLTPVLHTNIAGGMFILTWLSLSRFATLVQQNYGHRPSRCTKVLPGIFLSRLQQTPFATAVCAGTWALVLMAIVPTVVVYATMETARMDNNSKQVCYSAPVEVGGTGSQTSAIVGIIMFFLCLVLVLSAYMAVIRHINRTKINGLSDRHSVYSRVCRNILVIQIVLVICLLPHHTYKAIFIAMAQYNSQPGDPVDKCHPFSMSVEIKNVLLCLAVLRCGTDPITYFLLDKTFKRYACGMFWENFNTKDSQSSRTMNECGQLNQYNSGNLTGALTHKAPSQSRDLKTEQTFPSLQS